MTSITFDMLDASRSLRDAGVDESAAAAIVAVVKQTTDLPRIDHLATKEQVAALDAKVNDLRTLMFAGFGLNIASILGVAAFLYTVLK